MLVRTTTTRFRPQKTSKTYTREAQIINEAIYVGIIATGNAQTRPMIRKAPAGDSGGEKDTKRSTRTHPRP
jgi:hypothetical protein